MEVESQVLTRANNFFFFFFNFNFFQQNPKSIFHQNFFDDEKTVQFCLFGFWFCHKKKKSAAAVLFFLFSACGSETGFVERWWCAGGGVGSLVSVRERGHERVFERFQG